MLNKRIIGGRYRPIEKIMRYFPSHLGKEVKQVVKDFVRKNILLSWKSGQCISINIKRLDEVIEIIEDC